MQAEAMWLVAGVFVLGACASEGPATQSATPSGIQDYPSDAVEHDQALSIVSFAEIEDQGSRRPIAYVINEAFDGSERRSYRYEAKLGVPWLSFTVVPNEGNLELPDAGRVVLRDGANTWESESGRVTVEVHGDSATVSFADVVLKNANDTTSDEIRPGGPFSGSVEGQLVRKCQYFGEEVEVPPELIETVNGQPLRLRLPVTDEDWSSDFCSARRDSRGG